MKDARHIWHFTRAERRAVFLLSALIVLLQIYQYFLRGKSPSLEGAETFMEEIELYLDSISQKKAVEIGTLRDSLNINVVTSEQLIALGLDAAVAGRWIKYRSSLGSFRSTAQLSRIYGMDTAWLSRNAHYLFVPAPSPPRQRLPTPPSTALSLRRFDPNVVTEAELRSMGLTEVVVRNTVKYRDRGGIFSTPGDFAKIYGLEREVFDKLKDSIDLPYEPSDVAKKPDEIWNDQIETPLSIDINRANIYQWQQLKGIGPFYAKRIVNFRDKLGGFISVDQVAATYGLPDSVFSRIRNQLILSPIFARIDINNWPADSLKSHPYVSWKQANIIVNYRQQHGAYQSAEDLYQLRIFDSTFVRRLEPYLTFQ